MTTIHDTVQRLIAARGGAPLAPDAVMPADLDEAHAIQEATAAALGGIAGWKVGAATPDAEATFAPLPAPGVRGEGAAWVSTARWVGVEVEIAFRVARTIDADLADRLDEPAGFALAFDAAMTTIEIVETRLDPWDEAPLLAKAADLFGHGGLIVGRPVPLDGLALDFASLPARLGIAGADPIATRGGNPAGDPRHLLLPLARHCLARGVPLRAGQIATTGSCTGLTRIVPPADCAGRIGDLPEVRQRIVAGWGTGDGRPIGTR